MRSIDIVISLCYIQAIELVQYDTPGDNGSRIKVRQRSVARQIKSTLPGFYSGKLALIYTLTHTLTYRA